MNKIESYIKEAKAYLLLLEGERLFPRKTEVSKTERHYKSYHFTCADCGATVIKDNIFPFLFCGKCNVAMRCSPEEET